jgi:hypothetical protein
MPPSSVGAHREREPAPPPGQAGAGPTAAPAARIPRTSPEHAQDMLRGELEATQGLLAVPLTWRRIVLVGCVLAGRLAGPTPLWKATPVLPP